MLSDAINKYVLSFLCVFSGLSPGTLLSQCVYIISGISPLRSSH
jgi:hypothetical protein